MRGSRPPRGSQGIGTPSSRATRRQRQAHATVVPAPRTTPTAGSPRRARADLRRQSPRPPPHHAARGPAPLQRSPPPRPHARHRPGPGRRPARPPTTSPRASHGGTAAGCRRVARRSASDSHIRSAAARAAGSPGRTSQPRRAADGVAAERLAQPADVGADTGIPRASASVTTMPYASCAARHDEQVRSGVRRGEAAPPSGPVKSIRSRSRGADAAGSPRRVPRAGRRTSSATARRRAGAARARSRSWPFTGATLPTHRSDGPRPSREPAAPASAPGVHDAHRGRVEGVLPQQPVAAPRARGHHEAAAATRVARRRGRSRPPRRTACGRAAPAAAATAGAPPRQARGDQPVDDDVRRRAVRATPGRGARRRAPGPTASHRPPRPRGPPSRAPEPVAEPAVVGVAAARPRGVVDALAGRRGADTAGVIAPARSSPTRRGTRAVSRRCWSRAARAQVPGLQTLREPVGDLPGEHLGRRVVPANAGSSSRLR